MSKPITLKCSSLKDINKGNPTYPRPITPIFACRVAIFSCNDIFIKYIDEGNDLNIIMQNIQNEIKLPEVTPKIKEIKYNLNIEFITPETIIMSYVYYTSI